MLKDFLLLLFPSICATCENALQHHEKTICTQCSYSLPTTNFHLTLKNPFLQKYSGRLNIHSAAAYYYFEKGEKVQQLIHQLKYKKQSEIGYFIGNQYGSKLKKSKDFNSIEIIVPVPLHTKKENIRGYNQSAMFAKGLAKTMEVPYLSTALKRNYPSESQTQKDKLSRWESISNAFSLDESNNLEGKHILLVDDVVTTGATLEACATALLTIKDVKISLATIAFAEMN